MEKEKPERQYVRTLTTGWRFTLPSQIRKARGWDDGTVLRADVAGDSVILSEAGDRQGGMGSAEEIAGMLCYLGSGGKMVIPANVREMTSWNLGERLAIKDEPEGVVLTACCQRNRCRSCGRLHGVAEVIDNLFLCSECWRRYVQRSIVQGAQSNEV